MSIIKQIKAIVADFTDKDGNIIDNQRGRYIKLVLDDERKEFIKQFIDLLLNTRFITEESKIYISDRHITVDEVYKELKYRGISSNINTIKSKINYDKNKIVAAFGDNILSIVTEHPNRSIDGYKDKLNQLRLKYSNKRVLNNIALKLPKCDLVRSISEEEFQEFLSIIKPYVRSHMDEISKALSLNAVGYIYNILSSNLLSEEDRCRRDILLSLLSVDVES